MSVIKFNQSKTSHPEEALVAKYYIPYCERRFTLEQTTLSVATTRKQFLSFWKSFQNSRY